MAYPDDFFQTVLEVGNAVADRYVGETALISRVYTDFRLEPGRAGDQVDLPFPGAIEFADRKNQDLNIQPLQSTRKSITLQQQPTASWEVREFDQYRAYPHLIRDQFLDPALKAGAEYLNQQIASLFAPALFNVHAAIPSAAAVTIKLSQIQAAWVKLAQAKVPVRDHGHFTLAVNPLIYGNLAGDPDFNQASLVGVEAAETARRRALVVNQFGAEVVMDHDMPISPSTYSSALFHRHAIGLVLRPLEVPPAATGVLGSYLNYRGIPFRLMLSYDFHRRSWIMALDFVFGLTVLRPEACCLILSNKS
jgi:hypothetical protein